MAALGSLVLCSSSFARNETLSFQKLTDDTWQVTVSGTDYARSCESMAESFRTDASQTPPLIVLFRNPLAPPLLFCGEPDPTSTYSYRLNLGRLASNVYRVQLSAPTLVNAILDTRPTTVPTLSNSAWWLTIFAVAVLGVAARRGASR